MCLELVWFLQISRQEIFMKCRFLILALFAATPSFAFETFVNSVDLMALISPNPSLTESAFVQEVARICSLAGTPHAVDNRHKRTTIQFHENMAFISRDDRFI